MGKNIEKIQSKFILSYEQLKAYPDKEMENIVKRELAYGIASFIMDNFDNLPVKFEVEEDSIVKGKIYKMSFILIDKNYFLNKGGN